MDLFNPCTIANWNDLVAATPGTSFFHTANWCRVLSESYGYKPVYFAEIEGGRFRTLVPMMEIDSFITGKRGVSLPFTDYCDFVDCDASGCREAVDEAVRYGRQAGWKTLELRQVKALNPAGASVHTFCGHILDLRPGAEKLFDGFRESTRRNIVKAQRQGVSVSCHQSMEAIESFYRLNCLTRRDHGLPPQPLQLFKKIHEHVISKGLGWVALASHGGTCVAGALYAHFGTEGVFKYGASDRRFQHLRPNNLVMWESVKHGIAKGLEQLCLGRTELENRGLLQFKRGWRGTERDIRYYHLHVNGGRHSSVPSSTRGLYNSMFRLMPMPLLKAAGKLIYRHIG